FASRFPGEAPAYGVNLTDPLRSAAKGESQGTPYGLRLSGSKTVGFSVGSSRGLGIDQSLKVTMVGKLARDLEVKAFLTDDNLPVQPEGNTEELKHLDKVYVQINSKRMEARLGDFPARLEWSRFNPFARELRGAALQVDAAGQVFHAGGGIAQGRFKTARIQGRNGVQGPYELLEARRFNGVIILPGTETVLLDGRAMKRGNENDYTIDYSRGTVTFTERHPISEDSEIVIDYQMGEDDYGRTTVTAGWEAPLLSGAVNMKTFFFREADDSGDPVRQNISDAEMEIIAGAGDDPALASASGIVAVEDVEDAYVLVPADSVPAHYIFVEQNGMFRLSFRQVDTGQGDYEPDGFTRRGEIKYRYVGEGNGSFVIGRSLPLPENKQVFTAAVEAGKGIFFASAEGDVSIHDRNTVSSIGDEDNEGGAFYLEGGLRGVRLPAGLLTLTGEYSMLEDRFSPADKSRSSYFYRNWNLEDVPLEGREQIAGASLQWTADSLWDVRGSHRRLERGDDISARRSDMSAVFGRGSRKVSLSALDSKTGEERDRRAAGIGGVYSAWRLVPRYDFETERYRSFNESGADTGRFYYQNTFGLSGRRIGDFRADVSFVARRTDRMGMEGGEWSRARASDELRFDAGYSASGRIIDLFLSHRTTTDASRGSSTHDLARVRYRDEWNAAGLTSDAGYRISSGEDRRLEKAVIFVGENEGDYDEEGREVGQRRGDYMVLYLPGGETEAVRSVELTWRLSFGTGIRGIGQDGGKGGLTGLIRRNVSVDQFLTVLEKSGTDQLLRLYLLDPDLLQRDDVTLYGRNSLRQEWSFLNGVRKYDLRLVFVREDEEDNRSEDLSTSRYNREIEVRGEMLPSERTSLAVEGGTRLRERKTDGAADQEYRVGSYSVSGIAGYRPRPSVRVQFELGLERRDDEFSGAGQTSTIATPSVTASVGRKVNLNSFIKFTWTRADDETGKPLFFLENGLRQDWNLTGQYRFTRNVSFGVNYNGRREKDYAGEVKTVHALKMECRAFF
ncbi:MAG TPA: hypothetical protein VLA34_08940, partial [Candidatus Krumholzibacterium sp.]|nr:hypothetical protein [Candidatus Krumholzibacterium sp.]